jgi:hypothetical protein
MAKGTSMMFVNADKSFLAAAAVGAAGFLTLPAPAYADPMIPLAPPCQQWSFPGDVQIREAATGWDVAFSATGQSAGGRATATGPGGSKSGNITGAMTKGGHVELTVRYDNGQVQQYVGDVGDDAKLRGVTRNNVPKESGIHWSTVFPISCSKAPFELPGLPEPAPEPAPPAPAPAPAPPPPEQPSPAERPDSDQDGLYDDDETDIYCTDPNNFDSDGDGVGDGQEREDGTLPDC